MTLKYFQNNKSKPLTCGIIGPKYVIFVLLNSFLRKKTVQIRPTFHGKELLPCDQKKKKREGRD
jgi:hypothetical protein